MSVKMPSAKIATTTTMNNITTATGSGSGSVVPSAPNSAASLDAAADGARLHRLQYEWTLHYTVPSSQGTRGSENWSDRVKNVATVATVEHFWGLFNTIPAVPEIASGSDYNLFRHGIKPSWEDESNRYGAKLILELNSVDDATLTRVWTDTCLLLIGGSAPESNDICGVVVSIRAKIRIALWVRTLEVDRNKKIADAWRNILDMPASKTINMCSNDESLKAGRMSRGGIPL